MVIFSRDELRLLIQMPVRPCVSIFMPAHRARVEIQHDPIRLKNLLSNAREKLRATGLRSRGTQAVLKPARNLINDALFWRYQSDGLALFLSPNLFRYYRVPLEFDELVVVANRFHVKPLLRLLTEDGVFYILALSQNQIRLFQGTRHRLEEMVLENVPASLADALKYDDPGKQLQFHTRAPAGKARRAAIFHGHGVGIDDAKDRMLRYFRQINQGIHELLREEKAPLMVAGVDYLLPIYKEVNTYRKLMSEGIPGNPDALSTAELHARARSFLDSHFRKIQEDEVLRYRELAGTRRTSHSLAEIIRASCQGRVELLFVAVGVQKRGGFDPVTSTVHFCQEPGPDCEDLLDFATVQTLMKGGTVRAISPENVPAPAPSAAIFRY